MLTPKDIAEKTFDRTIGRGYRMDSVDEYLQQISDALQEQIDKNTVLTEKLEALADKLEEYKRDEESLRTALLGAQKLGDSVIRESTAKAEKMKRDAEIKAEAIVNSAKRQVETEQAAFDRLKEEVSAFKEKLWDIYGAHAKLIDSIPGYVISPQEAADNAERAIDETPEQPQTPAESVEEIIPDEPSPAVQEDVPTAPEDVPAEPDDDSEFDIDGDDAVLPPNYQGLRFGDDCHPDNK